MNTLISVITMRPKAELLIDAIYALTSDDKNYLSTRKSFTPPKPQDFVRDYHGYKRL